MGSSSSRLTREGQNDGLASLLATLQIHRPKAISILAVAITFGGFWSAGHLPIEWLPKIELPSLTVTATWPGAAPRTIERRVTSVLEAALVDIPGTERVLSQTRPDQALIRLEVAKDRDLGLFAAEVADRLAVLRSALPQGVVPYLEYDVPLELRDEQGFMTLEVAGDLGPVALRRLADERLAPSLRSLPGISAVDTEGGQEREVRVSFSEDRLLAHRLTSRDLRRAVEDALVESHLGSIRRGGRRVSLLSPALNEPRQLERLAVTSADEDVPLLRLSELSQVELTTAPARSLRRIDGRSAVTIRLDRTPGSDLLRTASAVRQRLDALAAELPASLTVRVAEDRSEEVREELHQLAINAVLGLLGILCVLFLSLRHSRAVLAVLGSAAVALSAALVLMGSLGLSLNVFTLAGLVLLVGLLVDNGTMLAERLLVETRRSRNDRSATTKALASIWLPLVGCSLTTALVLVPLVYLSGELRALFEPLAMLTALTLIFSILSTAALVPVVVRGLSARGASTLGWRRKLLAPYSAAARSPRLTLLLLALLIGLPMPLLPHLLEEPPAGWSSEQSEEFARRYNLSIGSDPVQDLRQWLDSLLGGITKPFLENVEIGRDWAMDQESELTTFLRLPSGSGLLQSDQQIRRFEEVSLRSEAAERTMIRVAGDLAVMRTFFDRQDLATEAPYRLREELIAHALQLAGVEVGIAGLTSTGFFSGLGEVAGVALFARGPSWEGLEEVLQQFARRLEADPRVAEVDLDSVRQASAAARESLRLSWSDAATARTGIDAGQIADLMRSRLDHPQPSFRADFRGEGRLGVRLVAENAHDGNLRTLLAKPLPVAGNRQLRLGGIGRVTLESEQSTIERENQQYRREIRVLFRGTRKAATDYIDQQLAALVLPAGYGIERPQVDLFGDSERGEFLWLCAGLLFLVFLVMAGVLESWRLASWVLISTPLAWVGVATGFLWSGENFAEGAFFGVILTVGIAANAGVLLAARFRELKIRRPRTPSRRLVLLALRDRLHPLWTTTLTTNAGMLPLLVLAEGSTFWPGFAVAVCGGVTAAALLAPAATVALASLGDTRSV